MQFIRLKIIELYEIGGDSVPEGASDPAAVAAYAVKQFDFLPKPVTAAVEGDVVVISYPEEPGSARSEAERLAVKAARRAAQGDYVKAIAIFKKVLDLQPSLHSARRDLAMALVETGDTDNAIHHLLEVLRIYPGDVKCLTVLGNLYIQVKQDQETGARLIRKAIEVEPDNPWALNTLATLEVKAGRPEEARALYDRSIRANPDFPNPYYGKATVFTSERQPEKAIDALRELFTRASVQDIRSHDIYSRATALHLHLQTALAEKNQSDAFKAVQNLRAELEALSGFPVCVEKGDLPSHIGAQMQLAWKHNRDHHRLITRKNVPPLLLPHLEAHELSHLRLEAEARLAGKNRFYSTTVANQEATFKTLEKEVRRNGKTANPELLNILISGLNGQLYNGPLDMLIERHLYESVPVLRPSQFLSTHQLATEAWNASNIPGIRDITPRSIMNASLALNGTYALFLDDLNGRATTFAANYASAGVIETSRKLYDLWKTRAGTLQPGDETGLIDEFAAILGLREWYSWITDPGPNRDGVKTKATLNEQLRDKYPAAVMHLLSALQRFDKLSVDEIRDIAFEVGMLGQKGLDYNDPTQKYTMQTIPGEKFTGLQLMCLMYAGFQRFAPEQETGMDLHDSFLTALELFNDKQ